MINQLEAAIRLAVKAHADQVDKAGQPYILHPLRVMFAVMAQEPPEHWTREEMGIAAVLHDVIEDTPVSRMDLINRFSVKLAHLVDDLTRRKQEKESYESYIERIKEFAPARQIKLADLKDNLGRLENLTEAEQYRLRVKYQTAVRQLSPEPYCPCCLSTDVKLEQNESARWVQCRNPKCGMSHHVSMHPELERFFVVPQRTKDI